MTRSISATKRARSSPSSSALASDVSEKKRPPPPPPLRLAATLGPPASSSSRSEAVKGVRERESGRPRPATPESARWLLAARGGGGGAGGAGGEAERGAGDGRVREDGRAGLDVPLPLARALTWLASERERSNGKAGRLVEGVRFGAGCGCAVGAAGGKVSQPKRASATERRGRAEGRERRTGGGTGRVDETTSMMSSSMSTYVRAGGGGRRGTRCAAPVAVEGGGESYATISSSSVSTSMRVGLDAREAPADGDAPRAELAEGPAPARRLVEDAAAAVEAGPAAVKPSRLGARNWSSSSSSERSGRVRRAEVAGLLARALRWAGRGEAGTWRASAGGEVDA